MKETWKDAVQRQRTELAERLSQPLSRLAVNCESVWDNREALDKALLVGIVTVPNCLFMYAVDIDGTQISCNISSEGLLPEHIGRNRSTRPYMSEVPTKGFLLSEAYLSSRLNRPSLSALQVVQRDGKVLGYIGVDFDLRDLPVTSELYEESEGWRQIKGDPSIRSSVFMQSRIESQMDKDIEVACAIIEGLIVDCGMFQGVIHFSSSRATVWLMSDPYRYLMLDAEILGQPDVCMLYPSTPYPEDALIPSDHIAPILDVMKRLRLTDETFYLRLASINIFNGMISLTFSCDGSHYMPWQEFLEKDDTFWFGTAN